MREQKRLGAMVAVFVLAAAVLAGWWWTQRKEGLKLDGDIASLRQGNNELQVQVAEIPDAERMLEDLKVEGEEAKGILPEGTRPQDLISYIRQMMLEADVAISNVVNNQVRANTDSGFEQWEFTIEMRGDYDQIGTFINKMESFERTLPNGTVEKRFFRVSSITMTAAQAGMMESGSAAMRIDTNRHACRLVMQTFRYLGETL